MNAELLLAISLSDLWALVKRPAFVIAYMAIMVLLMLLVVFVAMYNERKFSKLNDRLSDSAKKQDKLFASSETRFEMLSLIDARKAQQSPPAFDERATLEEFCDHLRNWSAKELKLYYEPASVRSLVAGLAVSHFIILQGMSGTGKTSLAFALGEFLDNPSAIVPVQPMWKERSDLLGYYNEFTKKFNETQLLQKLYEANGSEKIFITVLDELNIARVEYYFAEFLSLMEIPSPSSRRLEIVSDKWETDPVGLVDGCILLPENTWFLGTANNDDSTFSISDKVYDRAMVLDFDRKAEPFEPKPARKIPLSAARFRTLVNEAIEGGISRELSDKLDALDAFLGANFRVSFGNRILKQIREYLPVYVACGGEEWEALDDILSKKVLRKLETQNLVYKRKESEALEHCLIELFGEDKMKLSLAALKRMSGRN